MICVLSATLAVLGPNYIRIASTPRRMGPERELLRVEYLVNLLHTGIDQDCR